VNFTDKHGLELMVSQLEPKITEYLKTIIQTKRVTVGDGDSKNEDGLIRRIIKAKRK